jgi:predicted transposase YdaD
MIDHDRLFKELLTTFFVEFLELFFPEMLRYLDTSQLEFLDKELVTDVTGGDAYEADIVAKAAFKQQAAFFIVHIEHQAQPEQDFSRRMYRYFSLMHLKYNVPVYPIAIFSDKSARREEPDTYRVVFPDMDVLNFRYRVIQLRRLRWQDFATRRNPIASALLPKMGMEHHERPRVLLSSLRLLAQLGLDAARKRLVSGFINTYLRLTEQEEAQFQEELAKLSPQEREVTMELTTTWKEEGIREGWQKGLLEGKQEGLLEGKQEGLLEGKQEGLLEEALNLTRRFLTKRIGLPSPDLEERMGKLSRVQLEQLFDAAYDFASSDDLQAWLDNNPPEGTRGIPDDEKGEER